MPAKKSAKTVEKKATTKKSTKSQNQEELDANIDYSQIDPPESNYELNVELMERVDALTKKLENASKAHSDFVDVFNQLKDFSNESIKEIDIKIKKKDEECYNKYSQLSKDFSFKVTNLQSSFEKKKYDLDRQFQQTRDEMEREFQQNEYEKAVEVLEEKGEIAVVEKDYSALKKECEDLKKTMEKKEKEVLAINDAKWKKEMDIILRTKDLEFQATSADMKAKIEQLNKEVSVLHSTIETLKDEIQEQRNLTRSVAEAAQGAVTQNFGKQ